MADSGCLTVDIAQALFLAGYDVDPLLVVNALNAAKCYTSQGLLYTQYVYRAFPQFSRDASGPFEFIWVSWNKAEHWILLYQGIYYDPWDGSAHTSMPSQYSFVSSFKASIKPSSVTVTVANAHITPQATVFDPFLTNLSPSQTYSNEVKRMQSFLTAKGFFQDAGPQDGFYGPKTQSAVDAYQLSRGVKHEVGKDSNDNVIFNTTDFGYWYDMTRAAANRELSIPTTTNA